MTGTIAWFSNTWAAALATFLTVWGMFAAFEAKVMSPNAKRDLAAALAEVNPAVVARRVPNATRSVFVSIFGIRQFSVECIRRSVYLSCFSVAFFLSLGFAFNYRYFRTMPKFMLEHPSFTLQYLGNIAVWVIIDFINIFKSRVILASRWMEKSIFFSLQVLSYWILSLGSRSSCQLIPYSVM
jgi:hypothetical protein